MAQNMLSRMRSLPIRGVLTVIGGFLVHSTISTGYIFGNMTPYLTSYLRARSESNNTQYSETVWISTANYLTMAFFMPILGWIEQKLSPRISTLIGGLIFSSGMLLTYFTMQHSLILTALTYGVINGAGKSIAYPGAVKCALKWFPNRSGLVTGIIICGIGFGTFVFNQVITAFINPDNLSPDETIKDDLYFTQGSLLDRVPYCFLMLGGVYTTIQLLAVIFLIATPTVTPTVTPKQEENVEKAIEKSPDCEKKLDEKSKEDLDTISNTDSGITEDDDGNYTPRQVLRSKLFYLLWVIYGCVVLGIFFVMNFYKTFSQTFIKDDHFLALAGSVGSAFNALGRPFWGAVGDKIGYRESLTIVIGVFGTAGATFTLCEYGGKVMLMIWLCLIYGTFSGFYALMPSLTVSLYGQKYYSVNYGLLFTCQIVVQLTGALLTSQLKSTIGWQGILYIGAGGIIFSFCLCCGMLVQYRLARKKEMKYSNKHAEKSFDTRL
ncbi:oxalate:formate antiporter-like [Haliotis rufescens]|uniref:oxalate:formate antiporter-like n=1 Tax=Haliotis rufescens TaxID=6454 RepID=UPI001EAFAEB4|nr:oxalate:formate antiporter-like [Haliotis rufescens]